MTLSSNVKSSGARKMLESASVDTNCDSNDGSGVREVSAAEKKTTPVGSVVSIIVTSSCNRASKGADQNDGPPTTARTIWQMLPHGSRASMSLTASYHCWLSSLFGLSGVLGGGTCWGKAWRGW